MDGILSHTIFILHTLRTLNGINSKYFSGRPLILYAADFGQLNIISYLLSKGADPNVRINI